jgi:hypothetical protein
MTRDDARKLLGGYATGSLTEAERKLLFEAALEDQDLFDELAREDELKQLLDEPGARNRLIAALTPPPEEGVVLIRRPIWIWSAVALAAVAFAVTAWTVLRPTKPVQVAQMADRAAPLPAPTTAEPATAAPQIESRAEANKPTDKKKIAPAAPAAQPAPAAPEKKAEENKADQQKDERDRALDAVQPPVSGGGGGAGASPPARQAREQAAAQQSAQQQPPPQPAPVQQSAQETLQVQAQNGILPAAPVAPRRSAPSAKSSRVSAFAAKTPRFALDYTVEPEFLTLRFSADGWLSLHFAPGDDTIALAHVTAGQTRREPIPNNATEAAIVFAVEAQTDAALGVQITRSDRKGAVEDPAGKRIEFLLKFY